MSTVTITQQQAEKLVKRLEALGTRLESANNPDWFIVASAAATLESLRLGLTTIDNPNCNIHWFGVTNGEKVGVIRTTAGEPHAH